MIRPEQVVFTASGMRRGARRALPIVIGLVPFGLVCGIASQGAGLSLAEASLMSALVFAGSAQLVALANWGGPAPVVAATLACLIVNLRMALMGPVLAPWLDRMRGWRLWGSLALTVDQNWALSVKELNDGGRDAGFLMGSGLLMWISWIATTAIGQSLGAWIRPPPGHPLFFGALAVFVAMLVNLWRGTGDALPWVVAALVAIVTARLLPDGAWYILAGAIAGSIAGTLRDRVRR
jgi:4-azaleucine resistance transporter AzlC